MACCVHDLPTSETSSAKVNGHGRPLDILVIDDDESTRRGLELSLGHFGHLVLSADGVKSAAAMLQTFAVDLVLCDLRLADGSGLDVLPLLPFKSPRVPVILISGAARYTVPIASDGSGFDAFLAKPVNFPVLERVVWRLLRRPL